jgi:hypothetical protein
LIIRIAIPDKITTFLEDNPKAGKVSLMKEFKIDEVSAKFYRKAWLNRLKKDYSKLVIISDLHCGHLAGLTPPSWQLPYSGNYRDKWALNERETWSFYASAIDKQKPIDILVVNGDCIDGKGPKSGGTELITSDRNEQCNMAVECINYCDAKDIIITRGTPFHTGCDEDWEDQIAKDVKAIKIGDQEWVEKHGVVFDFRHHVSGSSVPHSRGTAVAKEQLWNMYWSEREIQPKADFVIRSHIHRAVAVIDSDRFVSIVTPGLQGFGSKYGARRVSGTVDFGITWFDIHEDGRVVWDFDIAEIQTHKSETLKL